MIVHAFTCDHDPGLVCDVCDGNLDLQLHHENGRLHRHADGTEHRHGEPYHAMSHGEVEFLDDGPETPWQPDTTPREE